MVTFLNGKTAVICGGTQGIGFAIAHEFAIMGATCIVVARNEDKLKEIVAGLPAKFGQRHGYQVADFTRHEEVQRAIDRIKADHKVHILVNNTGGPAPGPITEATPEAFLAAFNQHIINNQLLVQALIPGMKEEGYGRIINIVSTSVRIPIANLGVSNTIRGATASWAKTMANELAPFGITVNNILPGLTKTQRLASLIENTAKRRNVPAEQVEKEMLNEIPAKRFGEPAEIAALATFLAGPAASYITGTSIPVDGGKTGTI